VAIEPVQLISIRDAADRVGVTPDKVRGWVDRGFVRSLRVPNYDGQVNRWSRVRIYVDSFDEFVGIRRPHVRRPSQRQIDRELREAAESLGLQQIGMLRDDGSVHRPAS